MAVPAAGVRDCALHVSRDYARFTAYLRQPPSHGAADALDPYGSGMCQYRSGVLSLHSACVDAGRTGAVPDRRLRTGIIHPRPLLADRPPGPILSGDRPALRLRDGKVWACGVPWDGKEQLYINACVPLLAICHIRRGVQTYLRALVPPSGQAGPDAAMLYSHVGSRRGCRSHAAHPPPVPCGPLYRATPADPTSPPQKKCGIWSSAIPNRLWRWNML